MCAGRYKWISHNLVAVIKHHGQKQRKGEKKVYFGLWLVPEGWRLGFVEAWQQKQEAKTQKAERLGRK